MDNFNLRTFLTENKLTANSKNIKLDEATQEELVHRIKSFLNNDVKYEIIDVQNVNSPEKYLNYKENKVMLMIGHGNQKSGVTVVTTNNPEHEKMLKALIQKVGLGEFGHHGGQYRTAMFKDDSLAELNVTASAKTLNDIIYQLLDDGHIQPETADDLLNAVSNSPSDDVYEADAERSPDNRKPENLKLDPDYDKGGKYYSEDGTKAFRIQPFKQNDIKYTKDQAIKQGKHIVGLEGGELKKFISDYMAAWEADKGDTAPGKTFK